MMPAGSKVSWGAAARRRDRLVRDRDQARPHGDDGDADLVLPGAGLDDTVLGDAQRLPNGNTMVDFSTKGAIQEVDANGNLLQEIQTATNFGYMQKRATLYGPPPR